MWLACGTAALAFDPLCGDGTGHAIREAILAAAVLRAIQRGANVDELLNHYQARLVAGFKRHLSVCSEFYGSGGLGPWWQAAAESIREGLAWCDHQLNSAGEFRTACAASISNAFAEFTFLREPGIREMHQPVRAIPKTLRAFLYSVRWQS